MSITSRTTRISLLLIIASTFSLTACSQSESELTLRNTAEFVRVNTPTNSVEERLVGLTGALVADATDVIVAKNPSSEAALKEAGDAGLPVLPITSQSKTLIKKLGAQTHTSNPQGRAKVDTISSTLVLFASEPTKAETHLLRLTGASSLTVTRDPRLDQEAQVLIAKHKRVVSALPQHYPAEVVYRKATVAGDTYLLFDNQHFLAMYGHPSGPALGVLGEQGPKASVARVNTLVSKYQKSAPGVTFQPAFEIITTVATAGPGKRKDYSARTDISELRPLVDAAKANGITVILDLQPGRSSMLEQAKYYEELLREPHVGLALDPEWKLGKKGKPLQRIGHVNARQVNEVSAWLAALTRENVLPQKMFVLHQFQRQMIRDRGDVNTNHPELATVIHVDGQGPTGAKIATWKHIRKDAPDNVHWGWKNFVDEDVPMLNTTQTWQRVKPHPDLITYQ